MPKTFQSRKYKYGTSEVAQIARAQWIFIYFIYNGKPSPERKIIIKSMTSIHWRFMLWNTLQLEVEFKIQL